MDAVAVSETEVVSDADAERIGPPEMEATTDSVTAEPSKIAGLDGPCIVGVSVTVVGSVMDGLPPG